LGTYTTASADFPLSQDGNRTTTDTWDGTSATIVPAIQAGGLPAGTFGWAGLQFVIPLDTDAESRPIDPPLVTAFTLTLPQLAVPPAGTLSVNFVPEAAPLPYSNSLLPGSRDEILLGRLPFDAGDTHEITVGVNAFTSPQTGGLGAGAMAQYLRSSTWNGVISLSLFWVGNSVAWYSDEDAGTGNEPTLVTVENEFHTGFISGPAFGRRARSRHDPRSGFPVASDELIRDGFEDGLLVSEDSWDPEDPEDRYVPSPLEGVVDDEAL